MQRLRRVSRCYSLADEAASWFDQMAYACLQQTGVRIRLDDGFRTWKQQADLSLHGKDPADRPGTSDHELGIAVDINVEPPTDPNYAAKRQQFIAQRDTYAASLKKYQDACARGASGCDKQYPPPPDVPPEAYSYDGIKVHTFLLQHAKDYHFYNVKEDDIPLPGEPWHYAYRRSPPKPGQHADLDY
jgi:hypothetical protein